MNHSQPARRAVALDPGISQRGVEGEADVSRTETRLEDLIRKDRPPSTLYDGVIRLSGYLRLNIAWVSPREEPRAFSFVLSFRLCGSCKLR